jgi:integrating conjugative element protein (TIGR03759 family)
MGESHSRVLREEGQAMPIVALVFLISVSHCVFAETDRQAEVSYADQLLANQQSIREQYGLDEEEWQRVAYLQRLDQPFGDNLSPIELLGKYAETDQERERYARLYTALYVDQMRRSQAWALAIQKIAQDRDLTRDVLNTTPQIKQGLDRLGIHPPITDATHALYQHRQNSQHAATTLFVSLDCDEPCSEAINRQTRQVLAGFINKVDIVFVNSDSNDQEEIIDWVSRHDLNFTELHSGKVELHFDSDHWRRLRTSDDVPSVIQP